MNRTARALTTSLALLCAHAGVAHAQDATRYRTLTPIGGDFLVGAGHHRAGDAFERTHDVVLTRRAADGEVRWSRTFDAPGERDALLDVQVHPDGSIYMVGWTGGAICPGASNAGARDAFVIRLSPSGATRACAQFGTGAIDAASRVRFLSNGDLVIAGHTRGDLEGQKWAGSIHRTAAAEAYDIFVTRRTQDGEKVWTRMYGTKEYGNPRHGGDEAWGLVVDEDDRVHVGGYVGGPIGGNKAPGGVSGVVLEYSAGGKRLRARFMNARRGARAHHLARDASGGRVALGGFATGGDRHATVHVWTREGKKRAWSYDGPGPRGVDGDPASTSIRDLHWNADGDLEVFLHEVAVGQDNAFEPVREGHLVFDGKKGTVKEETWRPIRDLIVGWARVGEDLYVLDAAGVIKKSPRGTQHPRGSRRQPH